MSEELKFYKREVSSSAQIFGWKQTYYIPGKELVGYRNVGSRCHLEVYLRSKRVITCLQHPKGTTIMERSGIGLSDIRNIFEDPRVHTKKGKKI